MGGKPDLGLPAAQAAGFVNIRSQSGHGASARPVTSTAPSFWSMLRLIGNSFRCRFPQTKLRPRVEPAKLAQNLELFAGLPKPVLIEVVASAQVLSLDASEAAAGRLSATALLESFFWVMLPRCWTEQQKLTAGLG